MPSNPVIPNISRRKLAEVFKTDEQVRIYEAVIYNVNTTLPDGIDSATGAADAAAATAASAQTNLNTHIADPTDAHDASAISVVAGSGITSTQVQAALVEINARASAITGYASRFLLMGG